MATDLPSSPPSSATPGRNGDHEELMRAALLGAGTSVWEWNVIDDTLDSGEGSNRLLGYAPGEIARRQADWNRVIHPDDLEDNHAQYERHARGETPAYESEYRARAKDGSWRWICERGRIVERTPDGRPSRMVGTLNDVSERRAAEARAEEMTERLQKIARHVPGILFQFRRTNPGDGHFPYISESSEEVIGLAREVLIDDAGALLRMTEPEDRQRVQHSVDESARTLEPWACEFRMRRPDDGSVRWVTGTATPQREPDGSLLWHGYLAETTRLREFDQARQAAAAAQTANQAMTEFLTHMSHELRTPLNVVLGFAQLMLLDGREALTEGQRQRVTLIHKAGNHLLAMIGQLLDITRIESGKLVLDPSEFAPAPLIEECAEMLQPLAGDAMVTLAVVDDVPQAVVRADRTRLKQVLLNLIGNAIKYNRRGGSVRIRVAVEPMADDGAQQLRFSIADTGVGIAADELERLGQAFHRGAHQRSGIEGSGIGLAIARRLVEAMDGRLEVQSTPGVGSTFSVCLPARLGDQNPLQRQLADVEDRPGRPAGR